MELHRPYPLPDNLLDLVEAEAPRFSPEEITRRHNAIRELMSKNDINYLLVYGSFWNGPGIHWLTHWPASAEAALVVTPGDINKLFVQFYNHVPQAAECATDCEVKWGGEDTIAEVIKEFRERGSNGNDKVGVIGPLGMAGASRLREVFSGIIDLNRDFVGIRLVKSPEEIDWMKIGAWYSDRAMQAVTEILVPGITERQLGDVCQRSWVPLGGDTVIHFFGSTSMDNPNCYVPRQLPSVRPIQKGDAVFCEISGAFWGYSGQVLRTFTIESEATSLFRDLHDTAEAAYSAIYNVLKDGVTAQEIVEASSVIEKSGFTTCDDLVHGYGGGYFPPIVGSASRPAGLIPDFTLRAGMLVVIQPNIIAKNEKAGVQTGECVLITKEGCDTIHNFKSGLQRLG